MRSGIIGFVLGAVLIILAFVIVRQHAIHDVEYELSARFDRYVFDGSDFPKGDFQMGRIVHRLLFPTRFTTTFYDAHYQEVKRADRPGRYGAVVTMEISNEVLHRFITLYRTPVKIYWSDTPWPMSVQLPPEISLDPAVVRNQETEIGEMLKNDFVGRGDASPDLAILLAGLSETAPADPPAVMRTDVAARDDAWWQGLRERLGLAPQYPFLVNLPRDYAADPGKHWPLILYITTGAESGTDLQRVRQSGLARVIQDGKQLPAVVISPQCPLNESWNSRALSRLLDDVTAKYRIDPDRIYLTGGSETWGLALAYPERLAAIVPIDGETDPADAARLKGVPVWAFHGGGDEATPITRTTDMLDAIRKAGGRTHLTISKKCGDIWDEVYAMDAVYTWLLAQKRGEPEVITPGVPMP
jgi:hypothetical protein